MGWHNDIHDDYDCLGVPRAVSVTLGRYEIHDDQVIRVGVESVTIAEYHEPHEHTADCARLPDVVNRLLGSNGAYLHQEDAKTACWTGEHRNRTACAAIPCDAHGHDALDPACPGRGYYYGESGREWQAAEGGGQRAEDGPRWLGKETTAQYAQPHPSEVPEDPDDSAFWRWCMAPPFAPRPPYRRPFAWHDLTYSARWHWCLLPPRDHLARSVKRRLRCPGHKQAAWRQRVTLLHALHVEGAGTASPPTPLYTPALPRPFRVTLDVAAQRLAWRDDEPHVSIPRTLPPWTRFPDAWDDDLWITGWYQDDGRLLGRGVEYVPRRGHTDGAAGNRRVGTSRDVDDPDYPKRLQGWGPARYCATRELADPPKVRARVDYDPDFSYPSGFPYVGRLRPYFTLGTAIVPCRVHDHAADRGYSQPPETAIPTSRPHEPTLAELHARGRWPRSRWIAFTPEKRTRYTQPAISGDRHRQRRRSPIPKATPDWIVHEDGTVRKAA